MRLIYIVSVPIGVLACVLGFVAGLFDTVSSVLANIADNFEEDFR